MKVSDLQQIRYRVGPYLESNLDREYYVSFIFKNNIKLYFYLTDFGVLKGIVIVDKKFCSDSNEVVDGIIFTREYNWKDDYVINENELVAYLGREEEVRIPESVESIGTYAFENSYISSIVLPSTTKLIKRRAFWFSSVKHVELCCVEVIEEEAFIKLIQLFLVIYLCHNSPPFLEVYYTIYAENWLIQRLYLFVIMTMNKWAFIVPVSCLLPYK